MLPLRHEDLLDLVERSLQRSAVDETEVILLGGRSALTRFAGSGIHQNVEEERVLLRARVCPTVWVGRDSTTRIAAAVTSDLSHDGVQRVMTRAADMAAVAPEQANWVGFAPPGSGALSAAYGSGFYDQATAESGPAFRANEVATALLPAQRMGWDAAGYYRTTVGGFGEYGDPTPIAIGNAWALRQAFVPTTVDMMVTVTTPRGGSGWATAWSNRRDGIDAAALGRAAYEKARASESATALAPGAYTVLLEPAAVAEIVRFLLPSFSLRATREERSLLARRWGGKLASDMLSMHADPSHPLLLARPFDDEGVESQRVTLLENGFHREFAVGWSEARAVNQPCNGYSAMQPTSADSTPHSVCLSGGQGTVDELQARHPNCLRVTRLWYTRFVNPFTTQITGMTRDGFFEMRGADIYGAHVNMRFNVNAFDVLLNTIDASEGVRMGDLVVPAIVTEGFTFSSATVTAS